MSAAPQPALDAEKSVLACLVLDPSRIPVAARTLTPDSFGRPAHGMIFQAMLDMTHEGTAIDLVTLRAHLVSVGLLERIGGVDYLCSLWDHEPTSTNLPYYGDIVAQQAARGRLRDIAHDIERRCLSHEKPEVISAAAEASILEVQGSLRRGVEHDWPTDLHDAILRMQAAHEGTRPGVVSTGYLDLDDATGGLHAGQVIVVAGRTSMGKSTYALNIALNVASAGGRVMFFALETTRQQMTDNAIARMARVQTDRMLTGKLTDNDIAKILGASTELRGLPVVICDDAPLTAEQVWAEAKAQHSRAALSLIVVDYLQLVRGPSKSTREQQVAHVSQTIRFMSKDLGVPVIAVAQVNRGVEGTEDRRPKLHHLRESGSIENDADVVMLLYRDEYYNPDSTRKGILEVYIAKQKVGRVGNVELAFQPQWLRIENLARAQS